MFGATMPTSGYSFYDSEGNTTKTIGSYKCGDHVQMQVCEGVPMQSSNTSDGVVEWTCTQSILDETALPGEEESELGVSAGGIVLIQDLRTY